MEQLELQQQYLQGVQRHTPIPGTPRLLRLSATATGLAAGTYRVTVTDVNLCTAFTDVTITQPCCCLSVTSTQVNVACYNGTTGTATAIPAGGTAPYTYSWNTTPAQSVATATGLAAGTYRVTVTDVNLCTAFTDVTITQPSAALSVTSTQVNVACYNGTTGTATAIPAGGTAPYTYSWNTTPAQSVATATGLAAGTYRVTVTDANLCTAFADVTITQPAAALGVTTTQVNVACFNGTTGTATAIPAGGTAPYTYSWNTTPAQNTATATGLAAGTYRITITDANLCTAFTDVTITQPAALVTIASSNSPTCVNTILNLTSSPSGGTPIYSYSWTGPNGFTSTLQNPSIPNVTTVSSGTYSITVTDENGCIASATTTVTINPLPTATISGTITVCQNAIAPLVNFTGADGTTPYTFTYRINSGADQSVTTTTGNSITVPAPTNVPGTFTYNLISVRDYNGCINSPGGSAIITITPLSLPTVTIGVSPGPPFCSGQEVTFSANVDNEGDNPFYEWLLNGNAIVGGNGINYTSSTLRNADRISLRVTGSAPVICPGSTTSNAYTMTINPSITPSVAITGPTSPVCPGSNVTFSVSQVLNGGISPSYQWWRNGAVIPGATGSTYTTNTLAEGDRVFVTMNSSVPCATNPATSNAINISLLPVPTISTLLTDQIYCQGVGALPITLAGGPPGVVFDITGGTAIGLSNQTGVAAIPSFTPAAGSALITVTPRANNCTGTPSTYNILVNPAPTVIPPGNQIFCTAVLTTPIPLTGTPSGVWSLT